MRGSGIPARNIPDLFSIGLTCIVLSRKFSLSFPSLARFTAIFHLLFVFLTDIFLFGAFINLSHIVYILVWLVYTRGIWYG